MRRAALLYVFCMACGATRVEDPVPSTPDAPAPMSTTPPTPDPDAEPEPDPPLEPNPTPDPQPEPMPPPEKSLVAKGVRFHGRVDLTGVDPLFGWSHSGFSARFAGASISVTLQSSAEAMYQPIIDGELLDRIVVAPGERTLTFSTVPGRHTFELYRETEAFSPTRLVAINTALDAPPPARERLIEIIGDSMSAGYGILGVEPHPEFTSPNPCTYSVETQSAYHTYGALTARALDADVSIIARSGWGVYRSQANDLEDVLPRVFDRAAVPGGAAWSFPYAPDVVVINLGTNDFAQSDPGQAYADAFSAFIDDIREKYPDAYIFAVVGSMLGPPKSTVALEELGAVISTKDDNVKLLDFGTQDALLGTGCDWHPNIAENERMAAILTAAIKAAMGW